MRASCFSCRPVILIWASPNGKPKTRIWVSVVYLGGEPRKRQQRNEEVRQREKE